MNNNKKLGEIRLNTFFRRNSHPEFYPFFSKFLKVIFSCQVFFFLIFAQNTGNFIVKIKVGIFKQKSIKCQLEKFVKISLEIWRILYI